MTLTKKIISVMLPFLGFACFAQDHTFLWPITNVKKGENILYKQQEYIGNEFNIGSLIIHAPKGSFVQAPTDGEVHSYNYVYLRSLTYTKVYRIPPSVFEKDRETLIQQGWNDDEDINYVSVMFSLKLENGNIMSISGLRPIKAFKTGEKIKRGDTIGTVGYFYEAITQPVIAISITERDQTAGDIMSPFGLKATLKKTESIKDKFFLSAEEAQHDLMVLVNALKEGFPGLYDYVSEKDFEVHISHAFIQTQNGIQTADFYNIIADIIRRVRDNHLAILSRPPFTTASDTNQPTIFIGWINDSLIVTRTSINQSEYYRRRVIEVDGIPADVLKEKIISYINGIEGTVESQQNFDLATTALLSYFRNTSEVSPKCDVSLTFDNGETVLFEGYKWSPRYCVPIIPSFQDFYFANLSNTTTVSMEKFPDQTAYIRLRTFDLTRIQQGQIAEFITSVADSNYHGLIIDLRNNRGGSEEVMTKIFSYIAQQPFYTSTYSQVNKKGKFDLFEHTTNYKGVEMDLFPEYFPKEGKEGYYRYNDKAMLPDEDVHFKGNVYVLTNEGSLSASAVFAGLVHKYKRGVVVGRETGSTYHQMKALKFAFLRLPNARIDVNVPLVKIVFDTCTSSIPHWRGVLPDYPLPLSLEELSFEDGDAILNHVKVLIRDGIYFKDSDIHEVQKNSNRYVWFILIAGCGAIVYSSIRVVNKKKYK